MTKNLIVLIGPTGVGKTELSLRIAEKYGAEIISSDSRQIYKNIPIGTAAATEEQMARVPHHFVGFLELTEYFSAYRFEDEVMAFLENYFAAHDNALMTGGSMMYIDAVCKGIDEMPSVDPEVREEVIAEYKEKGLDHMLARLKALDPEYYDIVDRNNPKRVIHGVEICLTTGNTFTSYRSNTIKKRPFNIIKIGLIREREELYSRINQRVDEMIEAGLIDEVKSVSEYKNLNALNTVGYKEIFKFLDGEWTLDFAIEKIKQNSRIYSRKQMTWFRKDDTIKWFNPEDEASIMEYIDGEMKK